ncbi:DUF664 domain-containing protein [bacterium]|nr:DUF664 domain-containing protein [bacterium]
MAHTGSFIREQKGWRWPLPTTCPKAIRSVVSNLNQTRIYLSRAVQNLDYEGLWKRPSQDSHAIGNLLMHMRGTEHQWVGNKIGLLPLERDRDAEFNTCRGATLGDLLALLRKAEEETNGVLAALTGKDLEREDIEEQFSVDFILHYTAQHFAFHTGQIVLIRKILEPGFRLYPA